jgi:16S rRNA G966 N2-methylase RsmD
MKLLILLVTLCLSSIAAHAQMPLQAGDVVLADLLYVNRAVIVFADSPQDPNFVRQMELLALDQGELATRDTLVIVDTDPAAMTTVRNTFRPRGFSLVLMEKDGKAMVRKPLPWDLREITHAIDKSPLRRQEVLERNPSGR